MSSINGVGSGSQLAELLRQVASQRQSGETAGASPFGPPSEAQRAEFENRFHDALTTIGVSEDEASQIQEEIQAAIAKVHDGADGGRPDHDAIRGAIDGVLEQHGVDTNALREVLGPPQGGGDHPPADFGASYDATGALASKLLASLGGNDGDADDSSTLAFLQSLQTRVDATA
ncbi:MAG TPA: hypothetical protein P5081_04475 [Phycisphaerae bacterium]|nr:hypothetical protein [Phycisphaerae bacterium]HRW52117.1 hypothetical protein [Phycisphaerae bacterium]